MSTLSQIRESLSQAWDALTEGWYDLREKASHAITRFHPKTSDEQLEPVDRQMMAKTCRWGLLPAEVSENDQEVVVKLEVPGMDPHHFSVQVTNNYLIVQGEKQVQREQKTSRYYMMERAYGSFERAIPLPSEVQDDKAQAKYKRGVLRVVLPKREQAQRQRINVHVD